MTENALPQKVPDADGGGIDALYADWQAGRLDKHAYIRAMHRHHQHLFAYSDFLAHTDIESISLSAKEIVVTLKESGLRLTVDRQDSRFIPIEILNFGTFDPVDKALIYTLAGASRTIFDIGGNIGWYALNFSRLPGVEAVHSFEPIPRTFAFLKKHVAMNNAGNVILNNIGLSSAPGKAEFFWSEEETGSSSMRNIQDRDNAHRAECTLSTLDDYVSAHGCHIDFIKCDVEGAELFVFQGGTKTLARDLPAIYTEMLRKWSAKFGYHPNDLIALLKGHGYLCAAMEDGQLQRVPCVTEDTQATNFFFLHPEKHARVLEAWLAEQVTGA